MADSKDAGNPPRVVGRKEAEEALQHLAEINGLSVEEMRKRMDNIHKQAIEDMKRVDAMTNQEIIDKIKAWQACPHAHQLTCGKDSRHRPLEPKEVRKWLWKKVVVLFCLDCDYVQTEVPEIVKFGPLEL